MSRVFVRVARQRISAVGPDRCCSPRQMMPFDSTSIYKGSKCMSMMWRAIYARPYSAGWNAWHGRCQAAKRGKSLLKKAMTAMAHSAVLRSFRAWTSAAAAAKAKRVAAQVAAARAEADAIKLELSHKAAALQNVGPGRHCSPHHRVPLKQRGFKCVSMTRRSGAWQILLAAS